MFVICNCVIPSRLSWNIAFLHALVEWREWVSWTALYNTKVHYLISSLGPPIRQINERMHRLPRNWRATKGEICVTDKHKNLIHCTKRQEKFLACTVYPERYYSILRGLHNKESYFSAKFDQRKDGNHFYRYIFFM